MSIAELNTLTLNEFLELPETNEEILEFETGVAPRKLPQDEVLDGREVLPGFRCPVAEVFSWLGEER